MAEQEKTFLTIEHEASESSTCTDAMEDNSPETLRVSGGDCECSSTPVNYPRNPLVVRSGELPPANECHPSCPYGRNYQAPSCSGHRGGSSGHQPSYRSQSHSQDCGCSSRRARRTASSHYMEYQEFQHTSKPNPVYEPTDYSKYPPETPRRSSCSCRTPSRRQSIERSSSPPGERRRRHFEGCGAAGTPPRRQSAERSSSCQGACKRGQSAGSAASRTSSRRRSRRTSPPPKSYYLGRTTPAARAPDVRCHAHSHAQGSCKRKPPPPPSRKSRTTSASRGGKSRPCSACPPEKSNQYSDVPSDYVEKSRSGTSCLRNPIAPSSSYHESRSRSHSPSGRKPQTSGRKPCGCSNETLMEKPVNSYRFSCPENRPSPAPPQKLCPKCHKALMQKQRTASMAKKCASAAAQKYCGKCGLLPMMPRISIPNVASSNRCIYKTLGRPSSCPNPLFKAKYVLTLCCRKRRCQGGKNGHGHHLVGTTATNIKKRTKLIAPEGRQVSPTRSSNHPRRSQSSGPSPSGQAPSVPAPAEGPDQRRARSTAGHHRAAGQPIVQKRRHSEYPEPIFEGYRALAVPRADPRLGPLKAPCLASLLAPSLGTGLTGTPLAPQHTQGLRLPEAENHSSSRKHHARRERSRAREEEREQDQEREHRRHHHSRHRHHHRTQPEPSSQVAPQPRAQPEPSSHRSQRDQPKEVAPQPRSQPEPSHPGTPHHRSQPEQPKQAAPQPQPQPQAQARTQQMTAPNPVTTPSQMSHRSHRAATFLGTEINPFYRGSFLTTPSVLDSNPYHMGLVQQRTPEFLSPPKMKKRASQLMPPKWTGLGQLQSWVFGDSFIGEPLERGRRVNNGTWNWRTIFGKSKKRSSQRSRRSSEAGSQTDCSQAASYSDVSQRQESRVPVERDCTGSQAEPERMYVLRNCDRCQDYTVTPCFGGCQCPRRGTHCEGQCGSTSQESLPRKKKKSTKASPSQENPPRRVGGHCPVCPICGQAEIHVPGQNMCPNCNQRIHTVVKNYYVQCQGQCQGNNQPIPIPSQPLPSQPFPSQPPSGGHWQQVNDPQSGLGDQPFNIIVLQDGQNQQQMIDQLSTALSRSGGQVHMPQPPPPPGYSQHHMAYPPHNYSGNPLAGYIDYEYVDYDRGYEQDYGYDMGQGPGPGVYSSRHSYEDDHYQSHTSCNSYDCPIKNPDYQRPGPDPEGGEWQYQAGSQGCTCNCEFCRKGYETKEKLAMLIAQALEIFVLGRQEAKNQDQKSKKKNKKKRRRAAGKTDTKAEDWPSVESKPKVRAPGGSKPGEKPVTKSKFRPESPMNTYKPPPRKQEPAMDSTRHSEVDSQQTRSTHSEHSRSTHSEQPPFFLPNCEEQRCKNNCGGLCSRPLHDCSKGCQGHCRSSCSKSGGGDGTRKKGKKRRKQQPDQRHSRCHQCNQDEGRQWQEVTECPAGTYTSSAKGCNGCSGAGQTRSPAGGAKSSSALLGLSPIAHYRPGMMQFPVNYLLAGTNFRRRLVRTAAGVTLHQKPYVAKAEAKDLPCFPCRKESSLLDCRAPPPAKKWL